MRSIRSLVAGILLVLSLAVSVQAAGVFTFATLPGAPVAGELGWITDGSGVTTPGATAAGGGSGMHLVSWSATAGEWVFVQEGAPTPPPASEPETFLDANQVAYDGSGSGLSGATVQAAIDEVEAGSSGAVDTVAADTGGATTGANVTIAGGQGVTTSRSVDIVTIAAETPIWTVVAALPGTPSNTSQTYMVTDGAALDDCATGAGSLNVLCSWDGAAWQAIGGGGGSGGTSSSGGTTQTNLQADDFGVGCSTTPGTINTCDLYYDSSAGILKNNVPGGRYEGTPDPAIGDSTTWSEGSNNGPESFTLGTANDASASATCLWDGTAYVGAGCILGRLPVSYILTAFSTQNVTTNDTTALDLGAAGVPYTVVGTDLSISAADLSPGGHQINIATAGYYEVTFSGAPSFDVTAGANLCARTYMWEAAGNTYPPGGLQSSNFNASVTSAGSHVSSIHYIAFFAAGSKLQWWVHDCFQGTFPASLSYRLDGGLVSVRRLQ